MEASKAQATSLPVRILSGIEAGIIGGLAMLALLTMTSVLRDHVWWETLNLLGSTFYAAAGPFVTASAKSPWPAPHFTW